MYKVVVTTEKGNVRFFKSKTNKEILGAKIEYFPLDGRTKKAKKLRFFSINYLID